MSSIEYSKIKRIAAVVAPATTYVHEKQYPCRKMNMDMFIR